jgi:hypothetical protein
MTKGRRARRGGAVVLAGAGATSTGGFPVLTGSGLR